VERVKKIKDYAFIHFEDRDSAVEAMRGLNGKEVGASNIEVSVIDLTTTFIIVWSLDKYILKKNEIYWTNLSALYF